ncbi:MAG: methyltransferase [Actinomycetota bacterium]
MADRRRSQPGVWQMADLVTPMAIRIAATIRVADHLAVGRTVTEIAEAEHVEADALDRVLGHLADVGVFARDRAGRYSLTGRSEELRSDHPSSVRAVLDVDDALGRAELSFADLLHSVRTGEAAFPVRFGRPFWDDLSADPGRSASYAARMGFDVAAWAPSILEGYDWGSLGHVVDVGGGDGSLLIAMLGAHAGLRGTVVDLPEAADAARGRLESAGLAERSDVVSGSYFDPLPMGADGYLLSAILHDWNDDAARAILGRCAEAAGADGAVFVIEKIGPDGESVRTAMDLRMLAFFGGRERGAEAIGALGTHVGLLVRKVHPAGDLSIVQLTTG